MVCSLCNKYRPPTTSGTFDDDIIAIALKMTMLAKKTNELQQFVLENGMLKKIYIYVLVFFLYLQILIYKTCIHVYTIYRYVHMRFEDRNI